jgi:glycosyltransferase involved in cell wall biosynthesis
MFGGERLPRVAVDMSISVIIPTYNRSALLDRCIRSLIAAAVPALEIIVVDDGGTDDTEALLTATYPQVRYVRQVNSGPAAARNLGFSLSTGRYVAFIDSDDEWVAGGVRRLAEQLDANAEVDVLFADASMGNRESGFVSFVQTYGGEEFSRLPHEPRSGLRVFQRRPLLLQLSTRNVMFLGSMLFRREAFARLGGFDSALCGAADWDIFMKAVVSTRVAYSEGVPVSLYYKHDQAMSTNSDHMEEDFINALISVRTRCTLDPAEGAHIDRRIREHVFGWAYRAYDLGQFALVRQRLKLARRAGQMGPREVAFILATYLPPRVIGALRRTRHRLGV